MRRLLALLAALLLAVGLAGCGDDDDDDGATAADDTTTTAADAEDDTTTAAPGAEAAGDATVAVAETDLGEVLVDADGMTLYLFTPDTAEASACEGDCAAAWPPLTLADGEPVAGEGIDESLLGTAPRTDGDPQVTYNGHRLYLYAADTAAGDTTGQGVGDKWYAVTPAGEAVS